MADKTDDEASRPKLGFDANGPSIGGVRLTRRVRKGWVPAEQTLLERELLGIAALGAGDLVRRLDTVCRAMNMGNFAAAAIAAEHAIRDTNRTAKGAGIRKAATVGKAGVDDPKHPGWPAGTPDGKGGQFRPIDGAGGEAREAKLTRIVARRGLRSVLRRILTFKRVARLAAEIFGVSVPGLDVISGAATLADVVKLGEEAAAESADTEAAIAFTNEGPQTLEDLQVSSEAESFPSYAAFRKDDLEKRFGPAGDGYEYHHVVEQGPNAATFTAEQLNSTSNIIRIPRLIHEDVTSSYMLRGNVDGLETSLRDFLRNKPFDVQRRYGLLMQQRAGALR